LDLYKRLAIRVKNILRKNHKSLFSTVYAKSAKPMQFIFVKIRKANFEGIHAEGVKKTQLFP